MHKGYLAAYRGNSEVALKYLDSLHQRTNEHYVPPIAFASIHTGLNNPDMAIHWLNAAYENRDRDLIFLNVFPAYAILKDEKEFQELLKKIGLN